MHAKNRVTNGSMSWNFFYIPLILCPKILHPGLYRVIQRLSRGTTISFILARCLRMSLRRRPFQSRRGGMAIDLFRWGGCYVLLLRHLQSGRLESGRSPRRNSLSLRGWRRQQMIILALSLRARFEKQQDRDILRASL